MLLVNILKHSFCHEQAFMFLHGFRKVPFIRRHHHFPSFLLDLELVVHLSVDLWRREPYKVNPMQPLQLFSSLVAETRRMTSYTETFGCRMHKMVGYFQKLRVEVFSLLSQGISRRRFMCSIRCGKIVRQYGNCWARELLSMLQVHPPKCLLTCCLPLRILYPWKVGFQRNLLWGGLGHWKRLAATMLKLGLEPALFYMLWKSENTCFAMDYHGLKFSEISNRCRLTKYTTRSDLGRGDWSSRKHL